MGALNVIITGASSDIGRTIAEYLDATGAELLLVSRTIPTISVSPRHLVMSGLDLRDEGNVRAVASAAASHFHGSFVLVHCVGAFWEHKPLTQTPFAQIEEMISSHYSTLAATAWALLPEMVRRRAGRIIAFSCNSVGYAYPDMSPFTAAKAAVETLVKCLANEYAPYGIAATAVALPTVLTEKVRAVKVGGDHENYVSPTEVAELVLQLATSLPPMATGNIIKVFRHSPTFFNDGYFARNPRDIGITDDDVHARENLRRQ
jgi:NAD(P)-dependent dehydrogenase (short-subunit alcohol dehydrogenase family)